MNNGNITKITYQDGSYIDYTYDEWNRLTDEHKKNSGGQSLYQIQYSFNNTAGDTGNIYQKIVTRGGSPETTTFTYDAYNKLTNITYPDSSTETLTYDDNGQLITRNKSTGDTTTYEWNDQGFLKKVILPDSEEVEYSYDGAGRLVGRKDGEDEDIFVQSGWSIVTKVDENKNRTYYTGMSAIDDTLNPLYYQYNHRGDTVLVTDRDGNVLHDLYYEAYGTTLNSTGTPISTSNLKNIPNLFIGATGIRYDSKTDLSYMRFRWFSPEILRLLSPDLIQSINRYAYVSGNPITLIDPLGLVEVDFRYNPSWSNPKVPYSDIRVFAFPDAGRKAAEAQLEKAGYKARYDEKVGGYNISPELREKWGNRPFEYLKLKYEGANYDGNCESMALDDWLPTANMIRRFQTTDKPEKFVDMATEREYFTGKGNNEEAQANNLANQLSKVKLSLGDRLLMYTSGGFHWTLPMNLSDQFGNQWTFNQFASVELGFAVLTNLSGKRPVNNSNQRAVIGPPGSKIFYEPAGNGMRRSYRLTYYGLYNFNMAILYRWKKCKWMKNKQ